MTAARESVNEVVAGRHRSIILVNASFTVILLAYFLVWLPQPVAGLSFIGIELGEWVKFLPAVRSGEVALSRNFFYLPPFLLGSMIALWTAGWPNTRWQTWAARLLAIGVSLLALPALESYADEPVGQWLPRVLMVFLVILALMLAAYYSNQTAVPRFVPWLYFIILGSLGALLPLWTYLAVKPHVEQIFGMKVGLGPGLWLNLIGNGILVLVSIRHLLNPPAAE